MTPKKLRKHVFQKVVKGALRMSNVKRFFKEMDEHFKKSGWPLDYHIHIEEVGNKHAFYFVMMLNTKGYRVKTINHRLMIVKNGN